MLNLSGVLAVLDHHITLNWDDGPTLLKIAAQVRYHTAESATLKTLRVNASSKISDEPLCFNSANGDLKATWTWHERALGYAVQLALMNTGDDDVFVDAMDVMRVDSNFGGVLGLGAPTGLWQCANGLAGWDAWAANTPTATGFVRPQVILIQPTVSNRSKPPALLVRVMNDADDSHDTELQLEISGEKFERFVARNKFGGTKLGAGVNIVSPEIFIATGDDAAELLSKQLN